MTGRQTDEELGLGCFLTLAGCSAFIMATALVVAVIIKLVLM